jgi:ribosome maturation factor RimP
MDKESVRILVEAALEENPSLFLIDLQLLPNSKILVEVDGDAGVALNECIRISRAVEGNLDREEEHFR